MSTLPEADKSLGQHFLRDKNVINKITNDFASEAKYMVEVGPGPAVLTRFLAEHNLPFEVIEMDERFPEYLREFISDDQINLADALQVNLNAFFTERKWDDSVWMVSNLPYNISVPLTINFMQAPSIKYMTLMYQKEVAQKITKISQKKKHIMGSLMALCQNYFDCKLLCQVAPGAFSPPPKVDSAVVSFVRRETPDVPLDEFRAYEKFLRKVFALRRKQLGKVLKPHYPAEKLEAALKECNIERTIRAETFTYEQVIALYRALK
ncbi:MAG: ribosomal RNA small subunit methyltransferase A [Bacteriovoracaceae bacterium]|nr:ribosomal RNA small subunit methyltransferase A [Bacteriovoracaceae bacterium]